MISENYRIVPLIDPADHQVAGKDSPVIDITGARKVTLVVLTGAMTAVQRVTVKVGTASNAVTTDLFAADETVHVKRTNADIDAANGDLLTNDVALESGQKYWQLLTNNKRMYVQEINGARLAGWKYLRVNLNASGTEEFTAAIAIIETRYSPAEAMAVA